MITSSWYLSGCTHPTPIPSPEIRKKQAAHLAKVAGWQEHNLSTSSFALKAYTKPVQSKAKVLTVYIEGDGLSWLSQDRPSDDPTPLVPTALNMALHDHKSAQVAYLARPCQFVMSKQSAPCQRAYWMDRRFSPEVIESTNEAITYLKNYVHANHLILIGYSGGGTLATLVAAERHDVIQLITAAAVLDTTQWVQKNSLTPLYGSLNPADQWKKLASIPQIHWVGGKDRIAPKELAFAYAKRFPAHKKPQIIVLANFNHQCCWATDGISHNQGKQLH